MSAFFTTSIAILSIIIFAFYTTFAISPSKIDYFSNTPCNNQQYTNIHISVLFTLPKPTFNNKILSSKADKSTFYMMLKIVFAQKADNNNNNYKLISCGCVPRVSRFFIRNNQNQELIISHNIAELPSKQKLLKVKLKKKQLNEWLYFCKCNKLNIMQCKNVLYKPYYDLVKQLDMLESYFYINIFVYKTYLILLTIYYDFKTNGLENIYNCLPIIRKIILLIVI